ncbi:hypothetical protein PGT21_029376 [Puccinia graminis f. sp. tritici]|uniref:Secreted protein n=1 Tax=Puccinia graminis f. sp. tritici TaxID=56615 RepID=A0A5B0N9M8_PUCGR|nr:hypothetical protein PGT21_029376 [Puccinia graminis f. sp. tritici]
MTFMNFLQSPRTTLLIIAFINTLQSTLADVPLPYRMCDIYFYPSGDSAKYMCRSNHKEYSCSIASCGEYDKPWDGFVFTNCNYYINNDKSQGLQNPIQIKASVSPLQYHIGNDATTTYVDAQDRFDRHWYRCPYSFDDSFNLRRATCTDCALAA